MVRTDPTKAELEGTLNSDQRHAFTEIIDFVNSSFNDPENPDAIVLRGYAGTGKTYLVNKVIQYISKRYSNRKIAATAPTNKAVKVLAQSANKMIKSKVHYLTVHKLLGLKEDIDVNGRQKFVASHENSMITDYKYLIVDEVSMLNDDLCIEIMKYKGKLKIIFMGDPAQIPPVNKEDCLPFMPGTGGYNMKQLDLEEIMRQKKGNPIIKASFQLRDNLTVAQPISNLLTTVNSDEHGIIRINSQTQRTHVRDYITEYFKSDKYANNPDHIKIIGWRNKTVQYLNNVVREVMYGKDINTYEPGESLVANGPIFARVFDERFNNYKYQISYATSDEFVIEKVEEVWETFSEKYRDAPPIEWKGKFWRLHLKDKFDCLQVVHEDSAESYKQLVANARKKAMLHKKKSYWVNFFNIMKWSDNVAYNYAITAHKSQGSTYSNVILLEEDLDYNRKVVERNRIKYTAYTRAKNRLFILK